MVDTPLCKLRDALCMPIFFVKDFRLALAPKTCPDQSQAFKEVIKLRRLPFSGAPRHACTKFGANILRTDCVRPIISRI